MASDKETAVVMTGNGVRVRVSKEKAERLLAAGYKKPTSSRSTSKAAADKTADAGDADK